MFYRLRLAHLLLSLFTFLGLSISFQVNAECGGALDCIAISLTPGVAPSHGTPLNYNQDIGSVDLGQSGPAFPIQVAGVSVNGAFKDQLATISAIELSGSHAQDFVLDLGSCEVGIPSLPNKGPACTFSITFSPTAAGARSAILKVRSPFDSGNFARTVNLTATGVLPPPAITSPQSATGQVGVAFNYPITGSFQPTSFGATPLPDGLAVDSSTGIISGTPTTDGITDVTISATNASGTGSATLRITVSLLAPVITSGDSVSLTADEFFSGYTIAATNDPDSFGATDLPPGLTVDPTTGVVSGIATAAGAFAASVSATNATATASKVVTFNVAAVPPSGETGAVTAQLNSPTTIDFDALTSGTGVDQVRIVRQPAHGRLTLSGLQGTYTPAANYFGADSFTYAAVSGQTESPPAKVTIEVVGRPDPTQDADTRALQRAQIDTAKRVSRAQIANVQRRLETLHNRRAAASRPTRAAGPVADRSPASSADSPLSENVGGAALAAGDSVGDSTSTVGSPLLAALANVAQSGSMTLDGDYTGSSGALAGVSVWVGGNVGFGTRDAAYGSSKLRFTSDGISAGVDKIFNESLVLGLAFGYAKDQAEIGAEDSSNDTDFWSVSAYGSYQPAPQFFIDGMLGYGHLDYDSRRYVAAFDADAFSDRNGDQLFGSVAVSYEYRRDRLLLSPYGRVDFAFTWLDSSTETGAGQAALHYFSQDFDSAQLALGFRAESAHEMSYGWVIPRLRLEYLRQFESDRRQSIA
ncbi:MAG: autotransporter domain-containing protein, partial [Gammaproteobacteria bacterium]